VDADDPETEVVKVDFPSAQGGKVFGVDGRIVCFEEFVQLRRRTAGPW
jgi:hypothetical protein